MTQQHHPIVPPPEVMERLCTQAGKTWQDRIELAYQAGADAELEACVAWLDGFDREGWAAEQLRADRRPKPPSLKEEALEAMREMQIEPCIINGVDTNAAVRAKYETIRRALKSIPDPS